MVQGAAENGQQPGSQFSLRGARGHRMNSRRLRYRAAARVLTTNKPFADAASVVTIRSFAGSRSTDIRGFFDTIDDGWRLTFIEHRFADKRVPLLIHTWLSAGVMEWGRLTTSEIGSPQGATVSPLLANIYYNLDLSIQQWRKRHAHRELVIVWYADDLT